MKAFAIQFETVAGQYERNWNRALTFLNFSSPFSLVVFPEVFLTGFDYENLDRAAEFSYSVFDSLRMFSESFSSVFVFTILEKVNGTFYNVVKVVDKGKEVLSRAKIKLFSPFDEDKYFSSGEISEDLKLVETSCGVIAPFICFELRFPELFLYLRQEGAQIFTVSAQWGKARREHWKTLLRARAIENQRFVVASNGVGEMAGFSVIVDPWGRIISEAGDGESLIHGDINLAVISQVETKLPMR
ncbi:nitrilase-related carbon-nitrogen hydrolase [Desulfurobacterium indicum]|uniref:Nitrilase n=1 Tax=Desulfurobacterium indicum TaxID=1914305 RepID=A0A1R1MLL5_9BACT|nr:nitrilase-related carbon-nitrogen hydrolase [Desulfurobacterium indicum]OMH40701.1 nitrilase [Desulfurobacterium indicum]